MLAAYLFLLLFSVVFMFYKANVDICYKDLNIYIAYEYIKDAMLECLANLLEFKRFFSKDLKHLSAEICEFFYFSFFNFKYFSFRLKQQTGY